jgi:uncharacterized membrane protein
MDISLFSMSGLEFLFRWGHFLAGVCWIGMLWYFNFVQGAYFAEADAGAKSDATQKLVPRALWWFRWGAMGTFLSGVAILGIKGHMAGAGIFSTSWGVSISIGALMGTIMFLNVWLVIWPSQKIIIASAKQVASGGKALPEAAACASKALLASRTNTMFSVPMLFFMGAASHLPLSIGENGIGAAMGSASAVILLLEGNALFGKIGPLQKVQGVITCGFVLAVVLFGLVEGLS